MFEQMWGPGGGVEPVAWVIEGVVVIVIVIGSVVVAVAAFLVGGTAETLAQRAHQKAEFCMIGDWMPAPGFWELRSRATRFGRIATYSLSVASAAIVILVASVVLALM